MLTPEEQATLEANQKAEAEAKAKDAEIQADNQPDGSVVENKIDYKAIAESEKRAREIAEKSAADLAFKLREEKRRKEEADNSGDYTPEEKPLTSADLKSVLDEQNQRFEKLLNANKITEIAQRIATSPEEVEAIIETHRNRQFPASLTLEKQLEEAQAIVNAPKLKAINSEMARAFNSKGGVNYNVASSHQDALPGSEPQIQPDVKASLSQQGFTFNSATRRFEKKVNNRTLIYDEKIKKILTA